MRLAVWRPLSAQVQVGLLSRSVNKLTYWGRTQHIYKQSSTSLNQLCIQLFRTSLNKPKVFCKSREWNRNKPKYSADVGEYETINLYVGFMRGWRLTTCYFSRGAVKITITGAFLATSSVLFLFWCQLGSSWYTCCMLPAVHHTQSQQNVDRLEKLPSRAVGQKMSKY